jgi:oligoendopeptidase F
MVKSRSEVAAIDTWDLTFLYNSFDLWQEDLSLFQKKEGNPLEKIHTFQGTLHLSSENCLNCVKYILETGRRLYKLYTYAHLLHDQDVGDEKHKKAYNQVRNLAYKLSELTAWFEPELLQLPEKKLSDLLENPLLKEYKIYLERIIRLKPHTLSKEQEYLLSLAGKPLGSSSQTFSSFNNADLSFDQASDSAGNAHEVTHGSYHLHMESKDRTLRKNAFNSLHQGFKKFENTVTEMLQGQVNTHFFYARARKFKTSLEGALFSDQIDVNVYHSLIKTVKSRIKSMHKYVSLRKQILNVDKIHGYDMYVPCFREVSLRFSFEEAVELIIEAVKVLGPEYQEILRKGLTSQRWVDRYENHRKRSGAYSSGCYDSFPYILMNYQGTLSDVLTLAHEAGHSMHSFYSNKHQPYHYSGYTIFVAEVASTFNEELLFRLLMKKAKSEDEKIYLIGKRIDGIRGTLFRQTLFAEFELKIHELVESGDPLTPQLLKSIYKQLNHEYYGPDFCSDDLIEYEFLRIPHFYSNFYVYQYATGISAALALVDQVVKENNPQKYLRFLSSGCRDFSLNLLKEAGVDMNTSGPVNILIDQFDDLLNQLKS